MTSIETAAHATPTAQTAPRLRVAFMSASSRQHSPSTTVAAEASDGRERAAYGGPEGGSRSSVSRSSSR